MYDDNLHIFSPLLMNKTTSVPTKCTRSMRLQVLEICFYRAPLHRFFMELSPHKRKSRERTRFMNGKVVCGRNGIGSGYYMYT